MVLWVGGWAIWEMTVPASGRLSHLTVVIVIKQQRGFLEHNRLILLAVESGGSPRSWPIKGRLPSENTCVIFRLGGPYREKLCQRTETPDCLIIRWISQQKPGKLQVLFAIRNRLKVNEVKIVVWLRRITHFQSIFGQGCSDLCGQNFERHRSQHPV